MILLLLLLLLLLAAVEPLCVPTIICMTLRPCKDKQQASKGVVDAVYTQGNLCMSKLSVILSSCCCQALQQGTICQDVCTEFAAA